MPVCFVPIILFHALQDIPDQRLYVQVHEYRPDTHSHLTEPSLPDSEGKSWYVRIRKYVQNLVQTPETKPFVLCDNRVQYINQDLGPIIAMIREAYPAVNLALIKIYFYTFDGSIDTIINAKQGVPFMCDVKNLGLQKTAAMSYYGGRIQFENVKTIYDVSNIDNSTFGNNV